MANSSLYAMNSDANSPPTRLFAMNFRSLAFSWPNSSSYSSICSDRNVQERGDAQGADSIGSWNRYLSPRELMNEMTSCLTPCLNAKFSTQSFGSAFTSYTAMRFITGAGTVWASALSVILFPAMTIAQFAGRR